jgi:hypothetical protein
MYHITERNERRSRQHAIVLAIALHLALGLLLYLSTSEKPASKPDTSAKVTVPKPRSNAATP